MVAEGGFLFAQAEEGDELLGEVKGRLALSVAGLAAVGVGFGL